MVSVVFSHQRDADGYRSPSLASRPSSKSRLGAIAMRYFALVCAAAVLTTTAHARPVTYPGGSMSMTEVSGGGVMTQLNHTLSRRVAVGVYGLSESEGDRLSTGVYATYLILRQNAEDSQTNVYVTAGVGPSWSRNAAGRRGKVEESGWVAAEADWETRRLFLGGMANLSIVGGRAEPGWRLRAGVAPYVAESGKLHSWAFIQVGRSAEPGAKTEITPLIRLFKGPVLAEVGVSHKGRGFGTLWFYF